MQEPPVPETPSQSPRLARYQYQRVIPRQAPSPRVAPRMNPVAVSSPRVAQTLVITLTPHPEAENAPYVHQGMRGMNRFDTFKEEHIRLDISFHVFLGFGQI
jgi:hypothetical protein